MKWITREHVKVDRVACPWLIKKFIDPSAECYFVPSDKVVSDAKRLNAIPFDVKDVELGHHELPKDFGILDSKMIVRLILLSGSFMMLSMLTARKW